MPGREPRLVEQRGVGTDVDPGEQRVAGVARRTPIVHSSVIGGWYCSRSSRLRSKPPAASSTPRSANSRTRSPSLTASTPTTAPSLDDQPLECGVRADVAVAGFDERQQRPPDQGLPADHRLRGLDAPPLGPQRAPHERFEIAELGSVEFGREDRAALAQRAGGVGEVVGHAAPHELPESRILPRARRSSAGRLAGRPRAATPARRRRRSRRGRGGRPPEPPSMPARTSAALPGSQSPAPE